jgi:hypothetical protein
MRHLNLYLACVWLMLGVGCLVRPDILPPQLQALHVQMVVFAAAMCCYNLTRWWLLREQARYREAEEARPRRRAAPGPIDPTFDLDDGGPGEPKSTSPPRE